MRLRAAAAVLSVVAAAGAAVAVSRTDGQDVVLEAVAVNGPAVLQVDCTDAGTVVDSTSIAASADGVHLRFTNRTAVEQVILHRGGGDGLQPGEIKEQRSQVPPGEQEEVACARSEDLGPDLPRTRVDVVDPDGVFVPVPACSATSSISDVVEGSEQVGDPVELTRREAPDARGVGYPLGSPRQVFTGAELVGWEPIGEGWVPTYRSRC